jgi:DNA invertase Pin-like site-specific DNA recombinase
MKAIGYFRVLFNTHASEEAASSALKQQEDNYHRLCQERGYEAVTTFVDKDTKGKASLSQYQRMLRYIRKQQGDFVVVVKDLRHLNPDPQENIRCLLELDSLGVGLRTTDETLEDPLAAAFEAWSAQRVDEDTADQVRDAMRSRAIRGIGMGKPPYGYRIGENRKLEIVPQEADTVTLIYKLHLEQNMGVRLIARHLNEKGIKTRRGGRWSIVGIRDVLRNRTYVGTYARFGVKVASSHTAIIPDYIFRQVQQRLSANPKKVVHIQRAPFLLAGLIYCGYCGNKMIGINRSQSWIRSKDGGRSKGTYRYYQCQSRANQSFCQYHTRRVDELEGTVLATLQKFISPQGREQLMKQPLQSPDNSTKERPLLLKRLKSLDRKFRKYLNAAAAGEISLAELKVKGGELVRERQFLSQRLALIDAEISGEITPEQRRQYILDELENLQERWESMPLPAQKDLLQYVIDRVVVFDNHIETMLRL